MNVSMIRKTASKRSIRSGFAAAIALSVGLGSIGAASAADAVDAYGLLLDINDLRLQVTPPGLLPVRVTNTSESVIGTISGFSEFNAGAVGQSASPPAAGDIGERVSVSALWKNAEDVYNTLSARCDYWITNAAAPTEARFTIDDVQNRADAFWEGARASGVPGQELRVLLADVAALVSKSEVFLDGLAAVEPTPIVGRVSITKLNEQAEGVYQDIVGLCTALQAP
jgi:hypothetical protein